MKRIFTILLLAAATSVHAQDEPFRKRTYIKVNPTTIINELDLYLEQDLSETLSLELGVSGIYTDYPDYVFFKRINIGKENPGISTEQFVEGRGFGFRAGLKWYLVRRNTAIRMAGTYFEPVLLFKKVFYANEKVTLNGATFENSGDKNVYGLQLLLGRQMTRGRFILDPYLGVGVRSKVYTATTHHLEGMSVIAKHDEAIKYLPSIHLGIKVGLHL
ncbi:hypothetical protein [Chitinophaga deserti]|uniref:hypothetical protein n=1 Tax=Chitinophaga deserti TaxID=2164099 RepID=UPI000D6D7EA9|nr:hypothetical protein [Chitinophaga deserti]